MLFFVTIPMVLNISYLIAFLPKKSLFLQTVPVDTPIIELPVCESDIHTDFYGHMQLAKFYQIASEYRDAQIKVSFNSMSWFDANMCALFAGVLHTLRKKNNLTFIADFDEVYSKFEVLFRNGFLLFEDKKNQLVDIKQTTLSFRQFAKDDKTGFIQWIDYSLMNHRGMTYITPEMSEQIKDDLIELMSNVNYHSNTTDPFFVCGQYYPKLSTLKLTLVDLGEGFLPKINDITRGVISTDIEAINWALSGKTTKPLSEGVPGGLGIRNIYKYCKNNGGVFSIATGSAYWSTALEKTITGGFRRLPTPFTGTTINLHFVQK